MREEATHLAAVREDLVRLTREANGFAREIHALVRRTRARRVSLVEDEIQHAQDPVEPFGLVFADPPYGKGLAERTLASARAGGWPSRT